MAKICPLIQEGRSSADRGAQDPQSPKKGSKAYAPPQGSREHQKCAAERGEEAARGNRGPRRSPPVRSERPKEAEEPVKVSLLQGLRCPSRGQALSAPIGSKARVSRSTKDRQKFSPAASTPVIGWAHCHGRTGDGIRRITGHLQIKWSNRQRQTRCRGNQKSGRIPR